MKIINLAAPAAAPGVIPGIHHYCDGWCTKCPMTSQCAQYSFLLEQFSSRKNVIQEEIRRYLDKEEVEIGSLLPDSDVPQMEFVVSITEVVSQETEDDCIDQVFLTSSLHEPVNAYADIASAWINSCDTWMKEKDDDFRSRINAGLPEQQIMDEIKALQDSLELVTFYIHVIHSRVSNAVTIKSGNMLELYDGFSMEADGIAKTALLAMDHSLKAWRMLLDHFHGAEKEILHILACLTRLRFRMTVEFPHAIDFLRPGLDKR